MKPKNTPNAKERILEAAQRLFAEKGFWGTSVQDITDAAKVNKAMLFYYFKSKENLYRSLVQEILGDILNALSEKAHAHKDPMEKFHAMMDVYNELCFQPKNFMIFKIMFQDVIGPGERVKECIRGNMQDVLSLIESVINEGISQGIFRKVDPHLTALSIIGICYIFARHRFVLGDKFNVDDISPFIQSVILEGIKC